VANGHATTAPTIPVVIKARIRAKLSS
jgi:hypothetical protein